jgi:ABC-type multidrug transport system fused ATPase/permease subunit
MGATYFMKMVMTSAFFTNTNSALHKKLLTIISGARVSFFDHTPFGQIINRFSADLSALDKLLWPSVFDFLSTFFDWLVTITFLSTKIEVLLIPTTIVILLIVPLTIYFSKALIILRSIILAAESPVFTEITSTLNGLLILRVYN